MTRNQNMLRLRVRNTCFSVLILFLVQTSIQAQYGLSNHSLFSPVNRISNFTLEYEPLQIFEDSATTPKIDVTTQFRYRNFIIPTVFIGYGVSAQFVNPFIQGDLKLRNKVLEKVHRKYTLDDYIQYAPLAGIFAFDLMGLKAKHRFVDRVIITGSSAIIVAGLVTGIKHTAKVLRPDGSAYNSFPSGHTALAFFGAHILFKEYKGTSPWIGIGGYIVATTTAVFRVINNRHWGSDLLGGAGIGILSAELGYLLLPPLQKLFRVKNVEPVF